MPNPDWVLVSTQEGKSCKDIAGQPVYYFIADAKPGDINGQGVGGVWFTVAPDGALIRAAAGDGGTEDSKSDGGYGYP